MKIQRHVPMQAALAAAVAANDNTAAQGTNEFAKWYLDTQVTDGVAGAGGFGGSLLHQLSVPGPTLSALLPQVPDTTSGRAWAATIRECIALTESDAIRPFDYIEYDTTIEHKTLAAIEAYVEVVEATSPLLADVADTIARWAIAGRVEIDALLRERSRLTDDGLLLGMFDEDYCKDDDAYCNHLTNAQRVEWRHLDALVPGIETTVRDLLTTLDANLPAIADNDGGAARGRRYQSMRDEAVRAEAATPVD